MSASLASASNRIVGGGRPAQAGVLGGWAAGAEGVILATSGAGWQRDYEFARELRAAP